ncbi:WcaF family extracellular polysaccharide biosynthesis acetyltransferase [Pontibacter liquoris]|uniref:WcaF family extracellular polysaccharide biosynthesis acetyltransferase n=1 Tax=Pontibacter liquoris TaxID=2905677 RepID=UPI001FA7F9FB|nr:WcaF family extracellular polysaccharide biosynthesis acetyltransferase [Pontibacter liquoris]
MLTDEQLKVNKACYNNAWYDTGAGPLKRSLWFVVNALFFINPLNPFRKLKVFLLRAFGAEVGMGVDIKPGVNIKYPWLLTVGDHVWIGEKVWIDNLTHVVLHANVTLSQGAMLLTGSHDYRKPAFDLLVAGITLEEGVWIGAKAMVCPGVTCGSHSVLASGSVATTALQPFGIYQGNPATEKRKREITFLH